MKIMKTTINIFLVGILVFFCQNIHAQKNLNDFQTWYGTSLKVNLKNGWDVSGQYRMRLTDNSSHYKGSYLFGQVDKKLTENISVFTNYRLAMVDKGTYHRFGLGVEAQQKFGDFTVALRPMIQYQKQNFSGDDEGKIDTDTYLRPRLTVKYPLSRRLDAYVYAEPFYKLDKNPNLDWWQNSAGVKYEYSKGKKINLYYIWQPDYSRKNFSTNHIVGLSLDFTIKP
jgi:predicted porin